MPRVSLARATEELGASDRVMRRLIEEHGACRLPRRTPGEPFGALVRMIVYQQLAGSAAAAIHGRVVDLVGEPVRPETVLRIAEKKLKNCGLSRAKLSSILDLADRCDDGRVRLDRLRRLDDDRVIEELSQVRGIGEWTAQMFLMFELRRRDVWPVLDLGVRKGFQVAYRKRSLPTPRELVPLGDRFRPYRSLAAWYLWRAADA